jgi:hypothetical protein
MAEDAFVTSLRRHPPRYCPACGSSLTVAAPPPPPPATTLTWECSLCRSRFLLAWQAPRAEVAG